MSFAIIDNIFYESRHDATMTEEAIRTTRPDEFMRTRIQPVTLCKPVQFSESPQQAPFFASTYCLCWHFSAISDKTKLLRNTVAVVSVIAEPVKLPSEDTAEALINKPTTPITPTLNKD